MSVVSNSRWIAGAQVVRVLGQLLGMAVLARILSPDDYGLMAIVATVVALALLLRDMGTASAVIQKADLDNDTTNAVFWLNVLTGTGLMMVAAIAAPAIAWVMAEPRLMQLVILASLTFPIASAGGVHQALLERRSGFRTLARIEILSTAIALAVAIYLAFSGAGVFSLVAQTIVAASSSTVQLVLSSGWRPIGRVQWRKLRDLLGFSGNLLSFNILNYVGRNADTVVIGRFLGTESLGAYSLAYKLMLFPMQNLTFVLTRALFPVMSRQQADVPAMRALYLRALGVLAMLTAPLMAGATVLREPLIALVFGPQWSTSADVLAWLAPTGFVQSIVSTVGTVFMAKGRTDLLFRLGIFSTVMYAIAFAAGLPWGVTGVATFYFLANLINAIPCLILVARQLECSLWSLIRALLPPVSMAALMSAALMLTLNALPSSAAYHWPVFLALAFAGAAIYLLLLKLVARQDMRDLLKLVRPS